MELLPTVATKFLLRLPPDQAHSLVLGALKLGLVPGWEEVPDSILRTSAFGLDVSNPLGLAAGFDKDAVAVSNLNRLGFGFIEVGTATLRPQAGNPKPRLFRLEQDAAVINRIGFQSDGLDVVERRLRLWAARKKRNTDVVGVNLGVNRDSETVVDDYVRGFQRLAGIADYAVVNISSPNTAGLRDWQRIDKLDELLGGLQTARSSLQDRLPLLIKISPDLPEQETADIASKVLSYGLDGLVVGNTTTKRPETLKSDLRSEAGGLSGEPIKEMAHAALRIAYSATQGRLTVVGVGGITSADDAYARIRAGATLVQIHTSFLYRGPGVVRNIVRGLASCLRRDGFESVKDAIGIDNLSSRSGVTTREEAIVRNGQSQRGEQFVTSIGGERAAAG